MSDLALLLLLAAAKLIFHVATDGQYGFHRDELQTFADARHLAWGFVAYPPLTPFLGRVELTLFGTSLRGFRFFAALAQSVVFVITGLMAKRMGGGRAAQIIAAVAVAIAPMSLAASALMQYVSFDFLWYVLMAYAVIRLIETEDERWWLAIGAFIGLGVLTKYTVPFYVAGLAVGVLATPLRAHLRSKWLWIGAALSVAIAAPNLIWQWQHDFISFDFLRHIHERDVRIGRASSFIPEQFYVPANIVTVPLWLLGLVAVFRERRARVLGWMYITTLALFLLARGRGYYTGPLYPMLLAAGAVDLTQRIGARRLTYVPVGLLLALGAVSGAILVLPITPVHSPAWELAAKINPDFVEELGWPELVTEVARIYQTIPPDERALTGVFTNNYGEAGAIDLYGPRHGLPHAISGTNSFWLRGPGPHSPRTLIVLGDDRESLSAVCQTVTLAGHTPNPWNVQNEEVRDHPDIFICRGLHPPLETLWPKLKSFG